MTRIPFHPVLVALAIVLSSYAVLPGSTHPVEMVYACRAAVATAAVMLLCLAAVYRDFSKAALFLSVLLVIVAAFNPVYRIVEELTLGGWHIGRRRYVVPMTYLLVAAWGIWLYRRRKPLGVMTPLANMLALGALLPPVVTLGLSQEHPLATEAHASASPSPAMAARTAASKPDIYYIVFDRYGGEETLRSYGIDNDLDEYLVDRGFYVARESRSNYIKTVLSLGASLNLDYLDEIARGRRDSGDYVPIYDHVARHRVGAFLRSQGYSYVHLGSWYWPTTHNPQATRNVNYYVAVPRAVVAQLDSPLFLPLREGVGEPWFDTRRQNWVRVRRQIEDVLHLVPERGPKFVFLHVLVPHPPNVFDRDGSYVTIDVESRRSKIENYRNQLFAANAMLKRLVDGILRDSALPPVIIIQGDEGPYPDGTTHDEYDWRGASVEHLRERSTILNAYALPGADTGVLYPTISPVNSFRVVFNTYFGTNLPLLPDRTFAHISNVRPYAFIEITEKVAPRAPATLVAANPE